MADQYRVDLSELEGTITKLNGVLRDMNNASSNAKNKTHLPAGALGTGFGEAHKLYGAHDEMKQHIQEIVEHLNSLIDEFGQKTKKTHGHYQNSEYETTAAFPKGQ